MVEIRRDGSLIVGIVVVAVCPVSVFVVAKETASYDMADNGRLHGLMSYVNRMSERTEFSVNAYEEVGLLTRFGLEHDLYFNNKITFNIIICLAQGKSIDI